MIKRIYLIAVFLLLLCGLISCGRREKTEEKTAQVEPRLAGDEQQIMGKEEKEKTKKAPVFISKYGREDPFDPSFDRVSKVGIKTEQGGFVLEGIVWDTDNPTAIINGKILHIGEEIGDYEVMEIKQEKVTLSDDIQTIELKVR